MYLTFDLQLSPSSGGIVCVLKYFYVKKCKKVIKDHVVRHIDALLVNEMLASKKFPHEALCICTHRRPNGGQPTQKLADWSF